VELIAAQVAVVSRKATEARVTYGRLDAMKVMVMVMVMVRVRVRLVLRMVDSTP